MTQKIECKVIGDGPGELDMIFSLLREAEVYFALFEDWKTPLLKTKARIFHCEEVLWPLIHKALPRQLREGFSAGQYSGTIFKIKAGITSSLPEIDRFCAYYAPRTRKGFVISLRGADGTTHKFIEEPSKTFL